MADKPSPELISGPERPNISFGGKVLYSGSLSPEKRAEAALSASQTLYLVVSPLLFYGVDALLDLISSDSYILAVERDPDIYSMTEPIYQQYASRLSYVLLDDATTPSSLLQRLDPSRFRRIVTVKLNGGYMLSRNFYSSFASEAETCLQTFWKNRMTTIHMGRLWCRNIFMNIAALNNAAPLSDLATGKPLIVAGAGESLDGCISFIKKNRQSFFLIAADTAVSTLLDSGIEPDLLVVLEAQHANLFDFYNPEALKIPAAFDLTSSPEIIRKHQGEKYFFISDFEKTRLLSNLADSNLLPPTIPPLGSVGIASVYIALCLTKRPVFHCGLDFSFIPDKYHSSGAPSHILTMAGETRTKKPGFYASAYNGNRITRADKSGRTVYTDLIMLSYADRLRELSSLSMRLTDIAAMGIDSTGNSITDPELIMKLAFDPGKTGKHLGEKCSFDLDNSLSGRETGSEVHFLNNEIKKLESVKNEVIDFLNSPVKLEKNAELPIGLYEKIRGIDYTYIFFPDYYQPSADASFLKRLLYSVSWFKDVIRKTLSFFD